MFLILVAAAASAFARLPPPSGAPSGGMSIVPQYSVQSAQPVLQDTKFFKGSLALTAGAAVAALDLLKSELALCHIIEYKN